LAVVEAGVAERLYRQAKWFTQIVDCKELDDIVSAVLEQFPDEVEKYRSGKKSC
jgi:Asp-tRNA(Asn)/Glu-tRNA(Gln) amidotransferase B subunit